jgi:hypothetical protein
MINEFTSNQMHFFIVLQFLSINQSLDGTFGTTESSANKPRRICFLFGVGMFGNVISLCLRSDWQFRLSFFGYKMIL